MRRAAAIHQLDLFDLPGLGDHAPALSALAKPAAIYAAPAKDLRPGMVQGNGRGDDRPHWQTRAYSWGGMILAYADRRAPIEVVARGIPCVVSFGICTCTHAINPPGSLFWSPSGFRSFGGAIGSEDERTPEEIAAYLEAYIDAPRKGDGTGGLGGELVRWWGHEASMWAQEARYLASISPDHWVQYKGEEEGRAIYAEKMTKVAELKQRVIDAGMDPFEIAPDLAGALL